MRHSKPHAPYARKATFWNKQRIEKGFTLKEIGELINKHESVTGMYFSGQVLPTDATAKALCDLFDIDYNTGNLEFQHAHREWKAEHGAPVVYSSRQSKGTADTATKDTGAVKEFKVEDILTQLYGVLSCEDFIKVYDSFLRNESITNFAELIYGKFDFFTYRKILEAVSGSSATKDDKWSV